jgi:hypothetical protein
MRGDRPSPRLSTVSTGTIVVIVAALYGLAAIALPSLWAGVRPNVADLLVGWTMAAAGAVLLNRSITPAAWLIVWAGVAWFAVDFAPLLSGLPRDFLEAAALVYLAVFAHGVLATPSGLRGRVELLCVATVYIAAVAAGLGLARVGLAIAGVAMTVASAHRGLRSRSRRSTGATPAVVGGLVLGVGTCVTAALRLMTPSVSEQVVSRVLLLSIVVAAILVAAAGSTRLADGLRLDLPVASGTALENAIGAALGVRDLTVRFPAFDGRWMDPTGEFVDIDVAHGEMIYDGEHMLATVTGSRDGVAEAIAGLGDVLRPARTQALLQIDVRSQLRELAESRRRLLDAGDAERRQLERMLDDGALARVRTVADLVDGTDGLEGLRERVGRTLTELDGVARGIDPLAGRCLRAALSQLARQSALHVTVDAPSVDPPVHIARAVWYTCSEAIANAAKYAPGSRVSINLHDEASASVLHIVDDGPGGADPGGSGLRGLADRAAALGGSLKIDTDASGTRITLRVPVTGEG